MSGPNVVCRQVGISAFAWTAGHLSSSLRPASTYSASRTFKGQVGLKVGRSGSQVQGMLQDLARRALRVRCARQDKLTHKAYFQG